MTYTTGSIWSNSTLYFSDSWICVFHELYTVNVSLTSFERLVDSPLNGIRYMHPHCLIHPITIPIHSHSSPPMHTDAFCRHLPRLFCQNISHLNHQFIPRLQLCGEIGLRASNSLGPDHLANTVVRCCAFLATDLALEVASFVVHHHRHMRSGSARASVGNLHLDDHGFGQFLVGLGFELDLLLSGLARNASGVPNELRGRECGHGVESDGSYGHCRGGRKGITGAFVCRPMGA
jgi:hypothetical protein